MLIWAVAAVLATLAAVRVFGGGSGGATRAKISIDGAGRWIGARPGERGTPKPARASERCTSTSPGR